MAKFSNGFDEIEVRLINPEVLNSVAEQVYKFGRLSHDFDEELPTQYDQHNEACIKFINKVIEAPHFLSMHSKVGDLTLKLKT